MMTRTISAMLRGCLPVLLLSVAALSPAAAGPADSLIDIHVFPSPWMPGSGDPSFDAPKVTFANLPAGTKVTVYTIRGQQVWQGRADANGVLQWDGVNDRGRAAATGTYLALFDGGGRRTTRRVALVR